MGVLRSYGTGTADTLHTQVVVLATLALLLFLYIVISHLLRSRKARAQAVQEPAVPSDKAQAPTKRPSEMDDEELFLYISELIRREELYRNPLLDRQTLIKRLGVSAHRIGAAFSKGSEFRSLPGYIRSLRLEKACELLVTCPDLSVKAVGEALGFSNNSTFCSDFKTRYGVTPSGYRREKLSLSTE